MRAGFARIETTPSVPCMLGGYAGRTKAHDGVQAKLFVRCCRIRCDGGSNVTLLSGDLLWFRGIGEKVRVAVAKDLGEDRESVFICGIHSHSAPATDRSENGAWLETLVANCRLAAVLAETRCEPVSLSIKRGESHVNVNRREPNDGRPYAGPEGSDNPIRLGQNPDGPVDHRLRVVEFRRTTGSVIGTILHFACHGTGLWDTNYRVSPDWMGNAVQELESTDSHGTILYLNGAAANLDPAVAYQTTFDSLSPVVAAFVDDVETTVSSPPTYLSDEVSISSGIVSLPQKSSVRERGLGRARNVPLRRLDIGELRLLFFPGELFCQTGLALSERHGSPEAVGSKPTCPEIAVVTYADESDAGYVPVREAYDEGGYEVRVSPYADGAEEILRAALRELAR